jgi:hypothetical protein
MRSLLAAGLGALGWKALRGTPRPDAAGHTCTGNWICRSCGSSPHCALPQAVSYRKAAEKKGGSDG